MRARVRPCHASDSDAVACERVCAQIKDAQVELFIERKRTHEQATLFKEVRESKKEGEASAGAELRHWQRALLRAHEAHLGAADGMRSRLHELHGMTLEQQLEKALYWANGLEEVEAEALMPKPRRRSKDGEEDAEPGAALAKLKVGGKVLMAGQQSTNTFFKSLLGGK